MVLQLLLIDDAAAAELMRPSSFVCPFAMYAPEDVNENVPSIHRTNCAHYVLCPTNCTTGIHSTAQISMLMALRHTPIVGSVSMVMLIPYIYDTLDYCIFCEVCVKWREKKRTHAINQKVL